MKSFEILFTVYSSKNAMLRLGAGGELETSGLIVHICKSSFLFFLLCVYYVMVCFCFFTTWSLISLHKVSTSGGLDAVLAEHKSGFWSGDFVQQSNTERHFWLFSACV